MDRQLAAAVADVGVAIADEPDLREHPRVSRASERVEGEQRTALAVDLAPAAVVAVMLGHIERWAED